MSSSIHQISPENWALYIQGKLSEVESRKIDQFLKENGIPEEFEKIGQSHDQDSLIDEIRQTSIPIHEDIASRINPSESDVLTLVKAWPDIFSELGNPILSLKQTIGNYRLIENVSLSKMGRVYLAEDLRNGSKVAVKFPAESLGAKALERFRREIRMAKQLKHSQIVTVIDELQFREMPVYVMPWVEGVDLGRLVQFKGCLPIEDVIEIGRQSALILEYLNKHRVVHRDIKPSNLILTPTGEIKLIDLGLAILQQFDVTDESLTESVQILGSLTIWLQSKLVKHILQISEVIFTVWDARYINWRLAKPHLRTVLVAMFSKRSWRMLSMIFRMRMSRTRPYPLSSARSLKRCVPKNLLTDIPVH
jgi:hypothetical protein